MLFLETVILLLSYLFGFVLNLIVVNSLILSRCWKMVAVTS